ncbi:MULTISPECIES: 3-deoxy-manno-octulosonate cytidylyltransferase [Gammaproteobacteria]|uniref:3-deoxy-manno-octulosonate cytidylyltransferase n=1 Tax=Gammaproteobacteria TaxID=1236 RepID=UPI000DD0D48A|nr:MULTISPECIES: 3-deoxy-manno-octulosonate cytidylyltransferase [Gammaproteobacteria]RTE86948.1 3-deoxy-manno-octulosonate cytidylyltransferase [Aliidiomarina sp. B3213]TCZ93262.1 3-deoxy-manno-octulosonate cytidylyltransferase [Lysobacter sp. N42]
MSFTVIIPARYNSSRLPGKPLADINGKPMIQHVMERAEASGAAEVVVATDDERIFKVVTDLGGHAMMTSPDHTSGTERLAEVIEKLALAENEVVVNVQGDEPLIPPEIIHQVAENLQAQRSAPMATLAVPLTDAEEIFNPNAVKVVRDLSGYAMYFSRAPIPYDRERFKQGSAPGVTQEVIESTWARHIGIYAYRAGFVARYAEWEPSPIEITESLEQLRVLWHGEKIHVADAIRTPPAGVDTEDDLKLVRQQISQ